MNFQSKNLSEPPELRSQGQPPLLKQLELMLILFTASFIVAVTFALIFYFNHIR